MQSTFDTLTAARELEAAGIERRQAEAIADAIRHGQGDLATKTDIAGVRSELAGAKAELSADIAGVRSDLTAVRSELATLRWAIGLLAAFVFAIGLRVFGIL